MNSEDEVAVIAPFIKVDALKSLIEVIPDQCAPALRLSVVAERRSLQECRIQKSSTYSRPAATSVSHLWTSLHAKLYIAGDRCLAGSANVTLTGLGEEGNGQQHRGPRRDDHLTSLELPQR